MKMIEFARTAKSLVNLYQGTDNSFKYRAQTLIDYFGDKDWLSITPDDLQAFRAHLATKPKTQHIYGRGIVETDQLLSTATINKHLAVWGSLCLLAHARGILPANYANPAKFIKRAKENNARVIHVSKEDIERLIDCAVLSRNSKLAAFIAVAASSGARLGNLQQLTWADVDLTTGTVRLAMTKNGTTTTTAISPRARHELKRLQRNHHQISDLIFGEKYRPSKAYQTALEMAGLDKRITRIHDLRACCASIAIQSGIPTLTVQKILNHKTESMTRRYANLDHRAVLSAVDTIWS
jgi:integrase